MKHKSMKQIKEELREVNSDFKNNIDEINNKSKAEREKIKAEREKTKADLSKLEQKYQDDWDNMNEKKVKTFNMFMRTVGVLCLVVGLMCVFFDPLAIVLLIGGVFFVRFDANKKKSDYKEKRRQDKEKAKKK